METSNLKLTKVEAGKEGDINTLNQKVVNL